MKLRFQWPWYRVRPTNTPTEGRIAIKNNALLSAKGSIKHDEAGHAKGLACPGCYTDSLIELALED